MVNKKVIIIVISILLIFAIFWLTTSRCFISLAIPSPITSIVDI